MSVESDIDSLAILMMEAILAKDFFSYNQLKKRKRILENYFNLNSGGSKYDS